MFKLLLCVVLSQDIYNSNEIDATFIWTQDSLVKPLQFNKILVEGLSREPFTLGVVWISYWWETSFTFHTIEPTLLSWRVKVVIEGVHSNQKTVIYNIVLCKEICIFIYSWDNLFLHFQSHLEFFLPPFKIEILHCNGGIYNCIRWMIGQSALGWPLQIISEVNLLVRMEHIGHNAEVKLLAELAFLSIKDNLVKT